MDITPQGVRVANGVPRTKMMPNHKLFGTET